MKHLIKMEMRKITEQKATKPSQKSKIEALEARIAELEKREIPQNTGINDKFLETVKEVLDRQAERPKRPTWRGRDLVMMPNNHQAYLTPKQQKAKTLVDKLLKERKISKHASETALNNFLGNAKIRELDRAGQFWAKMYYKQYIVDIPKGEKR